VSTDLETRLRRYGDTLEHAIAARTVEAITSSANDALIEHAAAETGEPSLRPGWRRAGRARLIRHLVLVTLCSGILVVGVLLAIRSSGSTPSVTSRPAASRQFTDPILGFSASIPNGWHRAQQPLVGNLDPQELLSVGTIPLPANTAGPACDAQLPKTELDHLQPNDIYALVIENHFLETPTSITTAIDPARYPRRPSDFATAPYKTISCAGPTWSYPRLRFQDLFFQDHGRVIGLYLASGHAVTPQRREQLSQLLNSLRLTPNTLRPQAISGTQQTVVSTAVPDNIASVFQRGPVIGQPLVPGTTAYGFSANLNSVFVTADIDATTIPGRPALAQPPRSCTFWNGTLTQGGQGLGIQIGTCVPLSDISAGARAAVFVMPDFPKPTMSTWAWSHLPQGTAFVTFDDTSVQLWERPTANVASFVAESPGSSPILRAYDTHGHVVAQVTAPRFLGDPITPIGGLEHNS
jgi:hypothetical protein